MRVSFYAPWMKQKQFNLRRAYEYIHTVNSVNSLSFTNISRWYVAEMENKNKHKPWDTNWSTLLHRRVNPNSLSLWVLYLIFFIVTEMRSEQLLDEFKRVLFWKKLWKSGDITIYIRCQGDLKLLLESQSKVIIEILWPQQKFRY